MAAIVSQHKHKIVLHTYVRHLGADSDVGFGQGGAATCSKPTKELLEQTSSLLNYAINMNSTPPMNPPLLRQCAHKFRI